MYIVGERWGAEQRSGVLRGTAVDTWNCDTWYKRKTVTASYIFKTTSSLPDESKFSEHAEELRKSTAAMRLLRKLDSTREFAGAFTWKAHCSKTHMSARRAFQKFAYKNECFGHTCIRTKNLSVFFSLSLCPLYDTRSQTKIHTVRMSTSKATRRVLNSFAQVAQNGGLGYKSLFFSPAALLLLCISSFLKFLKQKWRRLCVPLRITQYVAIMSWLLGQSIPWKKRPGRERRY